MRRRLSQKERESRSKKLRMLLLKKHRKRRRNLFPQSLSKREVDSSNSNSSTDPNLLLRNKLARKIQLLLLLLSKNPKRKRPLQRLLRGKRARVVRSSSTDQRLLSPPLRKVLTVLLRLLPFRRVATQLLQKEKRRDPRADLDSKNSSYTRERMRQQLLVKRVLPPKAKKRPKRVLPKVVVEEIRRIVTETICQDTKVVHEVLRKVKKRNKKSLNLPLLTMSIVLVSGEDLRRKRSRSPSTLSSLLCPRLSLRFQKRLFTIAPKLTSMRK